MTTVSIPIDTATLKRARVHAAERNTTVEALILDYLARIARPRPDAKAAMARLRKLSETSEARVGPITWTRDDLYDR